MQRLLSVCIATIAVAAVSADAHFPFIILDKSGTSARLVMSETLTPDSDVGIDIVSGAKLWLRRGGANETPLQLVKAKDYMSLALPGEGSGVVRGVADLGVMKRGKNHLLLYYPKAIIGDAFDPSATLGTAPVEIVPVRATGGFKLKLLIDGKPAAGRDVRVLQPGGEQNDQPTDSEGLTGVLTEPGRYGAWARHWVDRAGERDGKSFEQTRHYATLVFDVEPSRIAAPTQSDWTPLPRAMASFGAIASDGWLYVYGGHVAERHEYSTASVSGRFHRLNLDKPAQWEELAGGVAVQGMNLAAHQGKIYRAGGMEPRNAPEDAPDNHSIADAAEFDPTTGAWRTLPQLPHPRSSHEVLAVDGSLMVIGGWWMKGKNAKTQWLNTIETLDLSNPGSGWQSIPQPFARRALVAAALDHRIFVIGGFDADEKPQLDVDIYDTASQSWTKGPAIPGPRRNGFAPAACAHNGSVYLSVSTGDMYRLSADGASWESVAKATPRIVHRLISFKDQILIVGGASEERMVNLIESVQTNTDK